MIQQGSIEAWASHATTSPSLIRNRAAFELPASGHHGSTKEQPMLLQCEICNGILNAPLPPQQPCGSREPNQRSRHLTTSAETRGIYGISTKPRVHPSTVPVAGQHVAAGACCASPAAWPPFLALLHAQHHAVARLVAADALHRHVRLRHGHHLHQRPHAVLRREPQHLRVEAPGPQVAAHQRLLLLHQGLREEGHARRLGGQAHQAELAARLEQVQQRVPLHGSRGGAQQEVQGSLGLVQRSLVAGQDACVRSQLQSLCDFAGGGGESQGVVPHGSRRLQREVAQPAHARHSDARARRGVHLQRREGGDAGAHERSSHLGGQLVWDCKAPAGREVHLACEAAAVVAFAPVGLENAFAHALRSR
mmetsp:Transcript_48278/g.92329  ORF Transcript_48278/g.92329 Transcript_48278/m.92329 type:complete len:364 (-) Transcript_48278:501-1592(-)